MKPLPRLYLAHLAQIDAEICESLSQQQKEHLSLTPKGLTSPKQEHPVHVGLN